MEPNPYNEIINRLTKDLKETRGANAGSEDQLIRLALKNSKCPYLKEKFKR